MTGNATSFQFFLLHVGLNVDIQLIGKKTNKQKKQLPDNQVQGKPHPKANLDATTSDHRYINKQILFTVKNNLLEAEISIAIFKCEYMNSF